MAASERKKKESEQAEDGPLTDRDEGKESEGGRGLRLWGGNRYRDPDGGVESDVVK